MSTLTPRPLDSDELVELRCALRSGVEPTREQAERLLATVDALQTAIVMQAGRIEDARLTGERA